MRYVRQIDESTYDPDLIIRRARKPYLCEGSPTYPRRQHPDCRDIKTGDEYLEVRWGADEFDPGMRVCMRCAKKFYEIAEIVFVKSESRV